MSVTQLQCLAKMSCYMGAPRENGCRGQGAGVCCDGQGCKSGGAALKPVSVVKKKDDGPPVKSGPSIPLTGVWDSLSVPAQGKRKPRKSVL